MKKNYKILGIVSLFFFITVFVTGCIKETPKFSVTMMSELFPSFEKTDGDSWLTSVEEYTDTDLKIQRVPTLEYVSQVEQMIRSDSLPMVITANETVLDKESVHVYLDAGGFWELEDYINDYPDLKNFVGEEIWENSKIQGHIYGIPRLRIMPRYTAYYRKDWTEKLGITPPETLDDIYIMLKAFTEQDPDGNGEHDTIGLADSWQKWGAREWNGIQTITTALGGPNGWKYDLEKEQMIPDFATEEYMDALNWFQKLYTEGIMDNSFAFLTPIQRQELFIQGRSGMMFGVIDDAPEMADRLREMNPGAEVAILPVIRSNREEEEYYVNCTAGYNGLIMFNRLGKGAIKNEEELKAVLSFYNMLCGEAGQELLLFGTEGEFYTKNAEGEKQLIYKDGNNRSNLSAAAGSYTQIMPIPAYIRTKGDSALQKEVYDCIEAREAWLVEDASQGLYSETYARNGAALSQRIQKASIRYIMGEISVDGFEMEYETWLEEGGKKVIEEFTEAYKNHRD